MAPPIRTARLSMEAFPECPSEFRPTLEKLLALLNEQGNAIAQALNGNLTRSENMRSKVVTSTAIASNTDYPPQTTLSARVRNPLPTAPTAVWAVRVQPEGVTGVYLAQPISWSLQGEFISVLMLASVIPIGTRTTITLIVE